LKAEQEQRTKAEAAERERQAVLKSQRAVAASQARATWDARDGDAYAGVFRDAPDNARREAGSRRWPGLRSCTVRSRPPKTSFDS